MKTKRGLKRWMISCRKAQALSSLGLDRPLRLSERLALWLHILMCAACRAYFKELRRLRSLIRRLDAQWPGGVWKQLPGLGSEEKHRLAADLKSLKSSEEKPSSETRPPPPPPPH